MTNLWAISCQNCAFTLDHFHDASSAMLSAQAHSKGFSHSVGIYRKACIEAAPAPTKGGFAQLKGLVLAWRRKPNRTGGDQNARS